MDRHEKESPAGDRTTLVCRPLGFYALVRFPLAYTNGKYLPPAGLKAPHSVSDGQGGGGTSGHCPGNITYLAGRLAPFRYENENENENEKSVGGVALFLADHDDSISMDF
ncbi:hypothetical protein FF011L_20660 [Roseimaritima multifibrata]|uniref:Uncharacterized protein n=1 Tax=Roseimaritima multifibrata TaxID=1930274 RepID=A0A517MEI6_9BACT|nr:hypothetical protein FF011L_20660 [Roseimaritima multifibrata]